MKTMFYPLSRRVIFLILFLILPLNFIAITASNMAIDHLVEQTRLVEQNLADAYMSSLSARMLN